MGGNGCVDRLRHPLQPESPLKWLATEFGYLDVSPTWWTKNAAECASRGYLTGRKAGVGGGVASDETVRVLDLHHR